MPVLIGLLRAVNVGGRNMMKMGALRSLCESLGFEDVATYVQSGNLVFRTSLSADKAGKSLEDGIEKQFGFRSDVILRTAHEMKEVAGRNPFDMGDLDASKLLVLFLAAEIGDETRSRLEAVPTAAGEQVKAFSKESYIYYPEGMGRSKLSAALDKVLRATATGRNWRTVAKLLQMADELEGR